MFNLFCTQVIKRKQAGAKSTLSFKALFSVCMMVMCCLEARVALAYASWPAPVFDQREWVLGYSANVGQSRFEEYTLKGESVDTWSELVTLQFFPNKRPNADAFIKAYRQGILQRCPKADIAFFNNPSKPHDQLWLSQVKACAGVASQDELGRVVVQPGVGLHVFHYATKKVPITDEQISQWLINLFKIEVPGS